MNIDTAKISTPPSTRPNNVPLKVAPLGDGALDAILHPQLPADTLQLSASSDPAALKQTLVELQNDLSALTKKVEALQHALAEQPKTEEAKVEKPKPEAAKVEQPKPAPAKPEEAKPAPAPTYTVQGGDSLSAIAGKSLGDANRWGEIFELNRDQISDPNLIFPGQVLKMPGGASAPAPAPATPPAPALAPAPAAPTPPAAPAATYTVQGGDSLSAIAAKALGNGDRWGEIFDLNRDQLSDPNVIQAGQVLKLPGGANVPAPAPSGAPAGGGTNVDRNAIYIRQPNDWTCGPTSLTMAAAAFGVRPPTVDTVNELTEKSRTRPEYGVPDSNALPEAASSIGLQTQRSGSSSPEAIRAALQRGHGVILNGSLGTGGHFLYVAGLNTDGSFKICDPWRPDITAMSGGELNHFAYGTAGGHGSMLEVWK